MRSDLAKTACQTRRYWLRGLCAAQSGGKSPRVISADAADIAVLQTQLHGVKPGDVIETKAGTHADAEAIQRAIADDADTSDVGKRHVVAEKPRTEPPLQFAFTHAYRQRR